MKIITNKTDTRPASAFDKDGVLFFDIETTGLSKEKSSVYLIGCAWKGNSAGRVTSIGSGQLSQPDSFAEENSAGRINPADPGHLRITAEANGEWYIRQYLAETHYEEEDVVCRFLEFAEQFETLVHFNGDSFDVPYIDFKASVYQFPFRLYKMDNYDILKRVRKARPLLGLSRMNQKSLEQFIGVKRDDEMGGGELIPVYHEYAETGEERLEHFLLLHNYDDIQGMLKISPIVNYTDIAEGRFDVTGISSENDSLCVDMKLYVPVPKAFEKQERDFLLAANDDIMQLIIKTYSGEARYFYEDYRNYYYLPAEDRAIHKDVAQFMDRTHRVRATRKNCYIKKKAVFLPQRSEIFRPCFYIDQERKQAFFEADELKKADSEKVREYVIDLIL